MKKIVSIVLSVFLLVGLFSIFPTRALATNNVDLYLFWGDGCPHCAKEKSFLAKILPNYPSVKLNTYEIYHSQENVDLMQQASDKLNVDAGGVPFLIIGDKDFVGYADGTTDKEIESQIKHCLENSCTDSVASILKTTSENTENKDTETKEQKIDNSENTKTEKLISLPFIGEVDAMNFSLPILTIFMGAVDGFNPCAMWYCCF